MTDEGARRGLALTAGLLGATAVLLGAYGAHGLEAALEGADDAARRLGWWQTGVSYHLPHAVAVAVTAALAERVPARVAGGLFLAGTLLFSGTLYAMALGAPRWLGAVTPLGGLTLTAGWVTLAFVARRTGPRA